MTEYDIRRFALILAVQAEIEGMKAENEQSKCDCGCPVHDVEDFKSKAQELTNLAYQPKETL